MEPAPVIDLGHAAQVALARMLDTARVIGHDEKGRRVIAVSVEDWVLDWFTAPPGKKRPRRDPATPRAADHGEGACADIPRR
jgi:hypothetical protein